MTQFLPPNLLALFAPRDPIPYLPPPDKLPHEKKTTGYMGIANFITQFEDPRVTPDPQRLETREERQERRRRQQAESIAYKLEQDIALWTPHSNTYSTSNAYKTLFVARINYDTSESKLRREFEVYGPISKIVIVHNNITGKPRGYAFIEYERERDMHSAYKHADGKKIGGRRVLVDVERGRTVKGWLPRRLGGGLGGTRRGGPDVNLKHSGREEPNRNEERYVDRERDRTDRTERTERRRSRSRDRERRRRSRSRERHRGGDRHKRERSRDRADRGGREQEAVVKAEPDTPAPSETGSAEVVVKKERRRSRSRDRERRRRRSRSRDRKRRDRDDKGDRDRDMRHHEPNDRDMRHNEQEDNDMRRDVDDRDIKQEPEDEGDNDMDYNNANDSNNYDAGNGNDNSYSNYGGEEEENSSYGGY